VYQLYDPQNKPYLTAASNSYAACYGAGIAVTYQPGNGMFYRNSAVKMAHISDGTSRTIAIGERACLFAQSPWAGAMRYGTIRTTPNAPVYGATVDTAAALVLARTARRHLNDPFSETYDFS
jgi:hypothetical protein